MPYVAATSTWSWSASAIRFEAVTRDARLSAEASDCPAADVLASQRQRIVRNVDACTEIGPLADVRT
ncbi:hypothetical protein ABT150_08435 [Streptomyces mirabilis]|uniref:hypothetical protein n=1 Tax=Streptomyces mirabilis TaxID=68239 RepID=UPI00332C2D48